MVAVLFARRDSVYKSFAGLDVYDEARDARTWPGGCPVIAHPPCRGWGRLRGMANPAEGELDLARFAVDAVRSYGGVVEHPAFSLLWDDKGLPEPGVRDAFGGVTYPVLQSWWGHRAPKLTFLYVVGVGELPRVPFALGTPGGRVELMGRAEREATPWAFAAWLVDLARSCSVGFPEFAHPGQSAAGRIPVSL